MAIIGPTDRIKPLREGSFFCPRCNDETTYRAKEVRRWFSLMNMPVLPLSAPEGVVECTICNGTYELNVLDATLNDDEQAFLANFEQAILHAMLLLMMSDGHIDDAEVKTIVEVYAKLTDKHLTREDVVSHAEHALAAGHTLNDYVASIADVLNDDGKRLIIRSMALVANADGRMEPGERETIVECAGIIGLARTTALALLDDPS
ncbi:MAG: TerB family tellurite resistance protein [Rhodobiaceae bacterium]|nr:TerB family tellurite resistance protein [Rhodobiaceae bacterium]MCC0040821.1 TerB family tellurite resistance protein [Rhodobiaceae bacterium]MCC0053647.1 TerB family tellurite resistance protein [Rhodobiaceae bacterium]